MLPEPLERLPQGPEQEPNTVARRIPLPLPLLTAIGTGFAASAGTVAGNDEMFPAMSCTPPDTASSDTVKLPVGVVVLVLGAPAPSAMITWAWATVCLTWVAVPPEG